MWTSNSLRRAGLCEEHFYPESFWNNDRLKLRPNQVPISYKSHTEHSPEGANTATEQEEIANVEAERDDSMNEESSSQNGKSQELTSVCLEKPGEEAHDTDEMKKWTESSSKRANDADNNEKFDVHITYPHAATSQDLVNIHEESEDDLEWCTIEPPLNKQYSGHEEQRNLNEDLNLPALIKLKQEYDKMKMENDRIKNENAKIKKEHDALIKKFMRLRKVSREGRNKDKKKIASLKRKKLSVTEFLDSHHCKNPTSRAMVTLQLRTKKIPFSKNEKDLAKRCMYYSASSYRHMRKAGLRLPHEATVRKWIAEYDIKPGFSDSIFSALQSRIEQLPDDEKLCGLKWDELSIKSLEEYSKFCDVIEGLVDLGPLGRRKEIATNALVLSLDSINAKNAWSQPIAYFLTNKSTTGDEIASLVKSCLEKLSKCGADVRILTCDQAGPNQKCMWTAFGTSKDQPYFRYKGRRYYCCFDFPHLIKRLVGQLRTHRYLYDKEGNIIANIADFVKAWQYDKQSSSQLLSHITDIHMAPNNWEVMNVQRAFQMLGKRFAKAIILAGKDPKSGLQESEPCTWEKTAVFIEEMDKVIDAANSYKLIFHNPQKRPLSHRNPEIYKTLANFVNWSMNWTTNIKTKSQAPCLQGLPYSINAILQMYDGIKEEHPNFELATGLCNQDSLEHLFSKLRQRGGHVINPTARMIRLSLRHILSTGNIQGGKGANVNIQNDTHMLLHEPSDVEAQFLKECEQSPVTVDEDIAESSDKNDEEITKILDGMTNDVDFDATDDAEKQETDHGNLSKKSKQADTSSDSWKNSSFYEQNAVAFFAGYIAYKGFVKYKCEECRNITMKTPMEDPEENELYIRLREYKNFDEDAPEITKLTRPTQLFTTIIYEQLKIFDDIWENYWTSQNLMKDLTREAEIRLNQAIPSWLDKTNSCYDHRLHALEFMFRVKLFAKTRQRNAQRQAHKSYTKKKGRKVSIVMNN